MPERFIHDCEPSELNEDDVGKREVMVRYPMLDLRGINHPSDIKEDINTWGEYIVFLESIVPFAQEQIPPMVEFLENYIQSYDMSLESSHRNPFFLNMMICFGVVLYEFMHIFSASDYPFFVEIVSTQWNLSGFVPELSEWNDEYLPSISSRIQLKGLFYNDENSRGVRYLDWIDEMIERQTRTEQIEDENYDRNARIYS